MSKTDDHVGSVGTVDVGQSDSVFRHTMGQQSTGGAAHSLGVTSTILGLTGALVGGSLLLVGAAASSSDDGTGSSSGSGLTTAGGVTLGIGAGLLALGIGLMVASPPTIQEGASTQFSLGDTGGVVTGQAPKKVRADSAHDL